MSIGLLFKHPGRVFLPLVKLVLKVKGKIYGACKDKVLGLALDSPKMATIYYCLFDDSFNREHHSVLHGKLLNIDRDTESLACLSSLRRMTHMIEKGLVSYPIKEIFAENYILNLIDSLEKLLVVGKCDEVTTKWVYNVLDEYFSIVEGSEVVKEAKCRYGSIQDTYPLNSSIREKFVPYYANEIVKSSISFDEFRLLSLQRRSVRRYKEVDVPLSLVYKAIDVSLLAPSACNRQPFRFIVVNSKDKLQEAVGIPNGASTFSDNIRMLVVIVGDYGAYFDERDRHLVFIDGGLVAMNFMMALETLGLSSCPINWPDIDEKEILAEKVLGVKKHEKGILFMSVGYSLNSGKVAYSAKKNANYITTLF